MNSQTKTTEEATSKSNNESSNKKSSSNQSSGEQSSNKKPSSDAADFRQRVSELAAAGASIAIRKAFDASLQSVTTGNGTSQMENVNWRKLLVWVAISGVTIGVAKFLNSETVDGFVKEYLED